jgi:hypothetical protein
VLGLQVFGCKKWKMVWSQDSKPDALVSCRCRYQDEGVRNCLPYFIALDKDRQAIVLSIRGTLSVADVMTDLYVPIYLHASWHPCIG